MPTIILHMTRCGNGIWWMLEVDDVMLIDGVADSAHDALEAARNDLQGMNIDSAW